MAEDELEPEREADPRVRRARYGADIEAALRSAIGQMLVAKAQRQARDARDELVITSIGDTAKMIELQMAARVGDAIQDWIAEAIEDGHRAHDELAAEEAAERGELDTD